jgi:succinoglycan biosynthesis transport protein ExoP
MPAVLKLSFVAFVPDGDDFSRMTAAFFFQRLLVAMKINFEQLPGGRDIRIRDHGAAEARDGIPLQLSSLLRRKWIIIASCAVFLLLGLVYLGVRSPTYQATSQLLIDHQILQRTQQDAMFATSAMDATVVQNQVSILGSQMIARRVVEELNLIEDPFFQQQSPGMFARMRNNLGLGLVWLADALPGESPRLTDAASSLVIDTSIPPTLEARRQAAAEILQSSLEVHRLGSSHLVEVVFSNPDPDRAALITNEIVRLYLADQAAANARVAQSASSWLRERISALGTSTRVISEASPPARPSGPGAVSILTASLVAGLLIGSAGAWFRDILDRSVRTPAQASMLSGAGFIGAVPLQRDRTRPIELTPMEPDAPDMPDNARLVAKSLSSFYWAVDYPRSRLAHTLRRVLVAAENPRMHELGSIGIISTIPGEGRTVMAANLATLAASLGKRVLLIDADHYKPDLTRRFGLCENIGLRQVLDDQAILADALAMDPRTGLHILPAGTGDFGNRSLIWTGKMEQLLQEAYASYDCVILDLPPLSPVADVRAAADMIGSLLLVIEWARIPADDIQNSLACSGNTRDKILGTVFNKVKKKHLAEADIIQSRGQMRGYLDDAAKWTQGREQASQKMRPQEAIAQPSFAAEQPNKELIPATAEPQDQRKDEQRTKQLANGSVTS